MVLRSLLFCLIGLLCWLPLQSQISDIVELVRRGAIAAVPRLNDAGDPSLTPMAAVDTTALGCRLIGGLPLPTPIEVFRLDFRLDDAPFGLRVSADGSLWQPCDARFPNLGAGVIPVSRERLDSDGDGLSDSADACPQIAGIAAMERAGCPFVSSADRDGDGSHDARDHCPRQAGAAATTGCALMRDEDGDGVPDHVDICPAEAGVARPDFALGCPADGGGSSTRRRSADDICRAIGAAVIYADRVEGADAIGALADAQDRAVIGRTAAKDWLQLASGWVASGGLGLSGDCFNIPLVNPAPGGATGCFMRARADFANVRQAPGGAQAGRIYGDRSFAALGQNPRGDWLFYRGGWVRRDLLDLAGACDQLPLLDPAKVASGAVHFCAPDYPGLLPPRIDIGERKARIASEVIANRLRAAPAIEAEQIGEIPPRAVLDALLDGPACKPPHIWWQVEANGLIGWTVESDVNANYYYLEPLPGRDGGDQRAQNPAHIKPASQTQPAAERIIHSANSADLDTIGLLAVDAPKRIAWSPDGAALAVVSEGGSVALYRYPHLLPMPIDAQPDGERRTTAAAFSPDAKVLAIGHSDGSVALVSLASDLPAGAVELGILDGPVRGFAWSRAGDRLAAVSGDEGQRLMRRAGALKLWELGSVYRREFRLLLHYTFPYPLTAVAFSADDRLLAVTGESTGDDRAGLWIYRLDHGALVLSKALVPMRGAALVIPSPDQALGDFVYSSGDSLYQISVVSGEDARIYHQAGELLPQVAFRRQVIPDAEALFAVIERARNGQTRLRIANALNAYSPRVTFDIAAADIAFSPDGRALAAAEPEADRVLILGVTEP